MRPYGKSEEPPYYLVFILRIWPTAEAGKWSWRASLEDTRTRQKMGFARLDDLCAYIVLCTTGKSRQPPE